MPEGMIPIPANLGILAYLGLRSGVNASRMTLSITYFYFSYSFT